MGDDPRPAQHKILQQCLRDNPKHVARDPNEGAMVSEHQNKRLDKEPNHSESFALANRSKEQREVIQFLAETQRSKTVKEGVMESISETLHSMNLREIRQFEQNLPGNLSQSRRSRRLQGTEPEVFHTTGNKVEDSRIIMDRGRVLYRK